MFPSVSQPAIANELLDNSSVAPDKSYTKVDFGFNNCNVQWGEQLSEVSEADMVKLATEANANGFTYHPSLNYGSLMVGYYPEGCKSPANESWPLYLKNVSDKKIVFAGVWLYEGKPGPVISVSGDNVTIDMSAYNRPEATGRIVSDNKISVTFKDDSTFTGELFDKKRIEWSNGTVWNR